MRLIFDIETNGLSSCDKVHCMSILDPDTGEHTDYWGDTVKDGISLLLKADELIGHNIISFDIPTIERLYQLNFNHIKLTDTLVMARLLVPDVTDYDYKYKSVPGSLIGRHSLKAWGYRIGEYKGDFGETNDWSVFTQEMMEYNHQDVIVTNRLYNYLSSLPCAPKALELEYQVEQIIAEQTRNGFLFNVKEAERLYITLLTEREQLFKQLQAVFPPFEDKTLFIPKVNNVKRGYSKGIPTYKLKQTEFNPGSRDHIARALKDRYGWIATEFTKSGKAEINEEILEKLDYPEIPLLLRYLMIDKRIGQLAEGDKSWLKLVRQDSRIHGEVIVNGTPTGRARHNNPNVSQIPKATLPYGKELRSLWIAREGYVLVDCDASQLELRCLAHFLTTWDKGAYTKQILEGDIHTYNLNAAGLETRDQAKTFIYATIYGAGDEKIGGIIGKGSAAGKKIKQKFLGNFPAFAKLLLAVHKAIEKGYLIGLDGRRIPTRSKHSALNFLLQGAGAVIMKKAMVLAHENLQAAGLKKNQDYFQVAWIHDAFTFEVKEEYAQQVGEIVKQSIIQAGEELGLKCPQDGAYHVGKNFAEVH